MTTIHFGVNDIPYGWNGPQPKGKKKALKGSTITTGDVAEILEAKYGIYEFFWNQHKTEIMELLSDAIEGTFESFMQGAPTPTNLFQSASSEIEALFQFMLDSKEMDNKVPGVPTAASLKGVSKRFKSKKNNTGVRPSFIDTGLYESSFHFWGDD